MEKLADVKYPVAELIARRWSPRAFTDKDIEQEKIFSIFEAGRWAPSAYNEQPWRFIVALKTEPDAHAKLLSCLVVDNQVWAKRAPMLFILVAKKFFDINGKLNRWAMHDCGLALENILLQSVDLGLFAHPMAGFSVEAVKKGYSVPDDYEPIVAVAVGYAGNLDILEGELKEREIEPRERKALGELVFQGEWGKSL